MNGTATNSAKDSAKDSATGSAPAAGTGAQDRSHAARNFRLRRKARVWGARLVLAAIIIGGWQWFTTEGWVDPFFFGQPSLIWHRFIRYWQEDTGFGSYPLQIETTMKEAVYGFLLGTGLGIVAGVALGMNRFVAEVLDPFIKVVNAIPRIVLGSIFVVAFGVGLEPKVLLSAVLVFFVVFFNAFQGVREVDRVFVNNARVLGASRLQIVRHVVLPSALTWITASLHVAFGFAVIGAIVGEFLGAQQGLGLVISDAQNHFNPNGVFAAMLIIAVIALTAESGISFLEKKLLAWRPPSSTESAGL